MQISHLPEHSAVQNPSNFGPLTDRLENPPLDSEGLAYAQTGGFGRFRHSWPAFAMLDDLRQTVMIRAHLRSEDEARLKRTGAEKERSGR
jgi:hypothetical protein